MLEAIDSNDGLSEARASFRKHQCCGASRGFHLILTMV
jgi:hypothetical protein